MEKTFEASLSDLEKIVRQLEEGDLPLEKSLELFETGVKLSRECRERLSKAERRIEVLLKDADGNPVLQDLEPPESLQPERQITINKRISFETDEDNTPF